MKISAFSMNFSNLKINLYQVPQKNAKIIIVRSINSTSVCIPKGIGGTQRDIWILSITAALFIRAKRWNQPSVYGGMSGETKCGRQGTGRDIILPFKEKKFLLKLKHDWVLRILC